MRPVLEKNHCTTCKAPKMAIPKAGGGYTLHKTCRCVEVRPPKTRQAINDDDIAIELGLK